MKDFPIRLFAAFDSAIRDLPDAPILKIGDHFPASLFPIHKIPLIYDPPILTHLLAPTII